MTIPTKDQARTEEDTMKRYALGVAKGTQRRLGPAGRRTTATILSAAALLLASSCSVAGSGGGGTYGLQGQAGASPAPTGPAGLTAKALKTGSIPGATVTTPTGDQIPKAKGIVAGKPCGPLARAVAGAGLGSPEDTVTRRVTGDGLVTTVTLASYQKEEKAIAALTDLSTAADACTSGFKLTRGGTEHQVTGAARELAPQGADQAMGFGITRRTDGTDTTEKIVIMRQGSVIALFTTAADPVTATRKSAGKSAAPLAVPLTIVETQFAALA